MRRPEDIPQDSLKAASEAGLRYVSDERPGIRRLGRGRSFRYLRPDGRPVRDAETLARIRSIAIPPSWRDVWISPVASGHIQAVGRDARGRKQYRYHSRWRQVRDQDKFGRMISFGRALPALRRRVIADLSRRGLPREKVLATVVRLLEESLIRVGNDEYRRTNHSFGLTTLRNGHAHVRGETLRFSFRGKGGLRHEVEVRDPRVARIVRRMQHLPGEQLFEYLDGDGRARDVDSEDVNQYLRAVTGEEFSAKDFRTWAATVLALRALCASADAPAKRHVVSALREVAAQLRNTPAVCRKSYVHPAIVDAYLAGEALARAARRRSLASDEKSVLRLLKKSARKRR
ncbi:MAG TPA: DNA topoisomerase IB [Myxococcales bacterium]|nr:DNA topoisomerase IB [Myxococcales bacterium]